MPKFKYSYQAINKKGNTISGTLEADSNEAANNILLNMGHIPYKLKKGREIDSKKSAPAIKDMLKSVSTRDLIIFTKQFRTMIKAGVPTLELLQILEAQTENSKLQNIIISISKDVKEGMGLHDAFKKHPSTFSPLYCSIINAGERSDALPQVLGRLIDIIEHEYKITSDIKSALRYPIYVLALLSVAFLIQLTFVIPRFISIFLKKGIDLPLPTLICMRMYQFLEAYWHIILISLVGGVLFLIFYLKIDKLRYFKDLFIIKMPVFGQLFIKASMSRFASIFSILQYSGVPLLESMSILAGVINNAVIAREFNAIKESISKGSTIAAPLKSAHYFPPMVINMVAIGEKTGNLDEMLGDISSHYDSEIDYAMKGIGETISSILTIGMAFVIGFFAFAVFLPMWDMTNIAR